MGWFSGHDWQHRIDYFSNEISNPFGKSVCVCVCVGGLVGDGYEKRLLETSCYMQDVGLACMIGLF